MSFEIEKSVILPTAPDPTNEDDMRRFNGEIIKFIDNFQNLLKKDLQGMGAKVSDKHRDKSTVVLQGTTASSGDTTIAHGQDKDKIISITSIVDGWTNGGLTLKYDTTNIVLSSLDASLLGKAYTIRISVYSGETV